MSLLRAGVDILTLLEHFWTDSGLVYGVSKWLKTRTYKNINAMIRIHTYILVYGYA